MKAHRARFAVLAALGLWACGSHSGPTGPTVASVEVTPSTQTLSAVGATQQFSAKALDGSGSEVTGVSVTWSSSATTVATISSSGLATAVTAGVTTITATVDGVGGSAQLTVSTPAKSCDQADTVSLRAGEFQGYTSADCLFLPSGVSGDRYRVAVLRPVGTGDEESPSSDTLHVTLTTTGVAVLASPPRVAAPAAPIQPIPGLDPTVIEQSLRIGAATERFESALRAREAVLVRRMTDAGVRPLRTPSTLVRSASMADLPNKLTFQTATPTDCKSGLTQVTGILIYQNADLAFYQDSTQQQTKPVSQTDVQQMADYYSTYAKGEIRSYFGAFPDVDGNGKIIVLVSPVVSGNEAGFVWTGNFYPKSACPASNQRDLIFFSADLIRAMDNSSPNWQSLETLAHEAKHVVSLYNRVEASIRAGNTYQFHPTWEEEGGAELSGELSSRIAWAAHGGPAVGAKVTYSDLQASGQTPWDYGVILRMARTVYYLSSQPNGLVVTPNGAGPNETIYGSGWHFMRWLADGYGQASTPMADTTLFRTLTDSLTPPGTKGLEQVTQQPFSTLFEQFVAAISLDESGAPLPAHGFTTYDLVTATNVLKAQPRGEYPWPVTTANGNVSASFGNHTYAGPIGRWGIRIHDFVSNGTGLGMQVRVDLNPAGRVVVVRVQ